MLLRSRLFLLPLTLGALSCLLTCSKKSSPTDNEPPTGTTMGVLLIGSDAASALSGTFDHGPFAVPVEEWVGDFATTRLEGVFDPNATVGAVNGALNSISAKISCMRAGTMFVELVVAPQADAAAAAQLCTALVTSGAFLSAYPCHQPRATLFPPTPANGIVTHLERARVPAAWNVRERVAALNNPVTVLVADDFRTLTPHSEIPAQTFLAGAGTVDLSVGPTGAAEGNHGFFVASLIGARFDEVGTTGLFADPGSILRLPCLATDGLGSWFAVIADLSDHMPATGQFILNTSFGYIPDFGLVPKRQRAEHAFFWRFLVAGQQSRFLHTQASGNEGNASPSLPNADNGSPFALAARFNTPLEMLQGTPVSTQDTADLALLYQTAVSTNPLFGTKLNNVLVVGSSDFDGNLSMFSNVPADVRMIGQTLLVPCVFDDSRCDPGTNVPLQAMVAGTSFAAPQVAALAAWLWALQPALTVEQTMGILRNGFDGRWIDAYKVTLSLDNNLAAANIRRTILDVANGTGQVGSNGAFDDADLRMLVDSLQAYESGRAAEVPPFSMDHSIFDLNGDGYAGDTAGVPSGAPFDLDINTPPAYSTVSPAECADTSFNESAVNDWDILFYYAHSSLYAGTASVRDSLLPCERLNVVATGTEYDATADLMTVSVLSMEPLLLDTTLAGESVNSLTDSTEGVSVNLSATAQCGQTPTQVASRMDLSYFSSGDAAITGLSGTAECAATDIFIEDTLCHLWTRTARANVFAGFEVRDQPVSFSFSASTLVKDRSARVVLSGPEGVILEVGPGENGGISGSLAPGNYSIGMRTNENSTASFSVTFSPLPPGAPGNLALTRRGR